MEADFSGYATKAGLKCTDGRTIMGDAFKHQDQSRVPLVWQHGHNDPENVLGHAILESRDDGVYAYGFFNESSKAEHARQLVEHKDINMMSIWANDLIERSKMVLHGAIREVSLVLSGANPGALIENVTIRHADGDDYVTEDEAIIFTGLPLEHAAGDDDSSDDDDEETVEDVYNSMSDKQKQVLHFMIGEALESSSSGTAKHADTDSDDPDATVEEVYNSMTEAQKNVVHYMVGEAIEAATEQAKHDNLNNDDTQKGDDMKHNVFEGSEQSKAPAYELTHGDIDGIRADATKTGSLKEAVENFVVSHGIDNIDMLFPDANSLDAVPEFLRRRTEWVGNFLGSARKSPFSRIKTLYADLSEEEARAKGYVKGEFKKEEFFGVAKRVTTPTTIYKKQKLDRDDMVDITDFDVVAWLKSEMRVMLDEEIARAALVGDGRDVANEDKINEQNIRPIASDHELYTTTIQVNIDDANSSIQEFVDAVVTHRHELKGTGLPNMYTTETVISRFLLLKDTLGRRIYKSLDELATELRVSQIIPVEVLEETPDILAIFVNPTDYVMGATRGGEVSMFDDFDIDYNQHKYLIETRLCGALVKLKSAMVVRKTAATAVQVTPTEPLFNEVTGVLTIVDKTGVVYKNGGTTVNAAGSPYAAIAPGASVTIDATPATGYYFPSSENDSWTFTRNT